MVGVAQLVERRIVIPVVVGSIPIVHPIFFQRRLDRKIGRLCFFCVAKKPLIAAFFVGFWGEVFNLGLAILW